MAVNLSPVGGVAAQFFTNNGVPLTGGKLFTYAAGTTTPLTTYTSSNGATAWTNPIVLDSAGRVPSGGEIWLTDGLQYKFVLKDSNDVLIATYDNISGINSNFVNFINQQEIQSATAGQTVFTLTTMQYLPGTGSLSVFVDGVNQYGPGAQYAFLETDSTTVTFLNGLHFGASVKFSTSQTQGAGSVDASQVSYTPGGTGAVPTNVQVKLRETVSVKDFGAVGNGSVDDTQAIQTAIDSVKTSGGAIYFPTGTYKISDVLTVDTGVYATGLILYGDGRNTIISQTGVNKDAIHFSTTQFLQNSGLRDMKIVCDATAGHCINVVYGCTTCFVSNVDLVQNNPGKSVLYGNYTSLGGGVYDTKFSGGSWYCAPTSTVPGVAFAANGTIFNENIFENLRCYNSKTLQFFYVNTTTTPTIWLINNTWRNINFEVCKGGGIYFDCFKNCLFQNISFWDAGGAYVNHLIDMGAGVGYESASNTFINVGRNGDSLAASVYDIRIVSGQDTTLIDCYTQSGDSPLYNFNNKRVTAIGPLTGTVQNPGGLFRVGSSFGQLQFPGTVNGAYLTYYDEGTWTATLTGSTASPSTPVTATGIWTRIGRQVFVTVEFLNVNTTGATGDVRVTGLPFTAVTSNGYGAVTIKNLGSSPVVASPTSTSTQINFYLATDRSTALTFGAGSGQSLAFSATYIA